MLFAVSTYVIILAYLQVIITRIPIPITLTVPSASVLVISHHHWSSSLPPICLLANFSFWCTCMYSWNGVNSKHWLIRCSSICQWTWTMNYQDDGDSDRGSCWTCRFLLFLLFHDRLFRQRHPAFHHELILLLLDAHPFGKRPSQEHPIPGGQPSWEFTRHFPSCLARGTGYLLRDFHLVKDGLEQGTLKLLPPIGNMITVESSHPFRNSDTIVLLAMVNFHMRIGQAINHPKPWVVVSIVNPSGTYSAHWMFIKGEEFDPYPNIPKGSKILKSEGYSNCNSIHVKNTKRSKKWRFLPGRSSESTTGHQATLRQVLGRTWYRLEAPIQSQQASPASSTQKLLVLLLTVHYFIY